jgi:lipoate-protein ligase A
LNYNLTLPITDETASITDTNCFIMQRHRDAIAGVLNREVKIQGHTDLTLGSHKFSGNAQRRKSRALVFHGCFLLNFNLEMISELLAHPSKEPDYRESRSHESFVTNLQLGAEQVKAALAKTWNAHESTEPPQERIATLVRERYENSAWNEKF